MATKIVRNKEELDGVLRNKMEDIMDEVYERLLDKLIDIIEEDVYIKSRKFPDTENPFYDRTHDILKRENWSVKKVRRYGGNGVAREIYFTGKRITKHSHHYKAKRRRNRSSAWTHGNDYFGDLEPESFLEILNKPTVTNDPFNFPKVYRPSFWDDFNAYCDKYYPILFKNACKRNGIDIK